MQVFAKDSKHLATMDNDFAVTLFALGTFINKPSYKNNYNRS